MDRDSSKTQAAESLALALKSLHVRAGEPSSRSVASEIGAMSHTTVSSAIRGERVPTWPVLVKIVSHYGGDEEEFRQLWTATRESGVRADLTATPGGRDGGDVSVFISYARVDNEATYGRVGEFIDSVKISYESMTGQQVRVFRDTESIEGGEPWLDQIKSGIASSAILLAFVSPAYLRSQACIQEYREFASFIISAESSIRVIVPLLFGDMDRIERYFGSDPLWKEIKALQLPNLSMIRQEAVGSPTWIAKTEEVVDRIEQILVSANQAAVSPLPEGGDGTKPSTSRQSTHFLEAIAQAEESAPETLASIERFAALLREVGEKAEKSAVPMGRATTAKKKLMHARRLARELTPMSREMFENAKDLRSGMTDWDLAVRAIADRVKVDPNQLTDPDTSQTLHSLEEMARVGVENLESLDEFRAVLGQTKGLSRELDVPLQVMEDAMRVMAETRGTLSGWGETIAVARSTASELNE